MTDVDLLEDIDETDAFGAMIRVHYEGEDAIELIEREDGWIAPSGGPPLYFAEYDEWNTREQVAMAEVDGRVLDVGCGAGRHCLYLQGEGHDITGIDLSPGAVEVCRERGVEDARVVDVADVADEFAPGAFDTVLMLGNNFGVVGTADRAPEILDALATVTTEDATIIAESMDPTATDEPAHLDYHERNRDRGRLPGAIRMRARYKNYATDWYDYLLVAPETMAELLAGTPWTLVDTVETDNDAGAYVGILERA